MSSSFTATSVTIPAKKEEDAEKQNSKEDKKKENNEKSYALKRDPSGSGNFQIQESQSACFPAPKRSVSAIIFPKKERAFFSFPAVFAVRRALKKHLNNDNVLTKHEIQNRIEHPDGTVTLAASPRKPKKDTKYLEAAGGVEPAEKKKAEGEGEEAEEEEEEDEYYEVEQGCRRNALRFLLSWKFELFLMFLLICDIIFLIVELEFNAHKVCVIDWKKNAGVIATNTSLGNVNCTEAPAISYTCEHTREFQLPAAYAACPFNVEEELPHHLHVAEVGIAWTSRSILLFFAVEIIALGLLAGPQIFTRHKVYLLDAIIIFVSIILDAVAATVGSVDRISELIILARLWRFIRLIHGAGLSAHDIDEGRAGVAEMELEVEDEIVQDLIDKGVIKEDCAAVRSKKEVMDLIEAEKKAKAKAEEAKKKQLLADEEAERANVVVLETKEELNIVKQEGKIEQEEGAKQEKEKEAEKEKN